MVLMGNDATHSDNGKIHKSLPAKGEELVDSLSPEENESNDINDGSDTSRVVDSATSYARECLRTENYTEAAIALRSVLEISKPTSTSYKFAVLHIAQLLKAAQQLDASIDCMLSLYQSMPSPFSLVDGICIIATLYEQRGSVEAAQFWTKKLCRPSLPSTFDRHDVELWEAMADRFFERDLSVFAADFYARAVATGYQNHFVPSIRFRYRYLLSLLSFVGPQGPTAHMNSCTSVAWSLAQWFRRRNGSTAHLPACYGDSSFYRMRQVYYVSFPAIYRVIFGWVDGPAGRIARWWGRLWVKWHPPHAASSAPLSISRTKRKANKKLTRFPALSTRERQPRSQPRTGLRGKLSASSSTSPSPTRKPNTSDTIRKKTKVILRRDISTEPGKSSDEIGTRSEKVDAKQHVDTPAPGNNADETLSEQIDSTTARRREYVNTRAVKKKSSGFYKHSPTKPNPSVLRRLKHADPTVERPSSAGGKKVASSDEQSMTRSSSTSLLDVYPLRLPRTEDFVAVCGREPGFADLDLNEVGEFARLAHYRARVLAGKHAQVDTLDTATVKPQWLQDLERAVALVETQQQRNLISGKVVVEGDSIAHLSEVHTRLVLQISTLCRMYTRDFGESSFTRRLRVLTHRLVEWKLTRISEVVAALNQAKSVAMQEEKQRNLEFYHVHHVVAGPSKP